MRRRLGLLALALLATGCDYYYNDIPSPDDALHLVPWFDGMIRQPAVHPYQRADIPRNTVPGTVPITGGEADWSAEWGVGNTTTADRLVNPFAGPARHRDRRHPVPHLLRGVPREHRQRRRPGRAPGRGACR